jgi:hypothetical protein
VQGALSYPNDGKYAAGAPQCQSNRNPSGKGLAGARERRPPISPELASTTPTPTLVQGESLCMLLFQCSADIRHPFSICHFLARLPLSSPQSAPSVPCPSALAPSPCAQPRTRKTAQLLLFIVMKDMIDCCWKKVVMALKGPEHTS